MENWDLGGGYFGNRGLGNLVILTKKEGVRLDCILKNCKQNAGILAIRHFMIGFRKFSIEIRKVPERKLFNIHRIIQLW